MNVLSVGSIFLNLAASIYILIKNIYTTYSIKQTGNESMISIAGCIVFIVVGLLLLNTVYYKIDLYIERKKYIINIHF